MMSRFIPSPAAPPSACVSKPHVLSSLAFAVGTSLWFATALAAATPEELRFFEEKVRPVLVTKCHSCHGQEKQKGGLRLDSSEAILTGGESGPAFEPTKPDESLLLEAIHYKSLEMPPDGKLPEEEIAALTAWIKMGAPWPSPAGGSGAVRGKMEKITDADRAYWAFQPVRPAPLPSVADQGWSHNPIDRFIFQRLAAEGLSPSPAADPRVLIRRIYFDLTGLPPTPAEVEAFLNDRSPVAYEQLVDRLLTSPRYGERWARHWLDLVRYAESDGFKQDDYRPHAWRYRDYVVAAFNYDKPYNQFVTEQLAGDEVSPQDPEALAATSYLRHWIYEYNQRDVRTQWSNILNDVTDVTGEVFLGVSVGCARCHDHKFDPILRKDYYRLQAFFAPLLPRDDVPFADAEATRQYRAALTDWELKTVQIRRQLDELERPIRENIAAGAINKFPPDIRPMLSKPAAERSPFEQQLAELAFRQVTAEYEKLDVGSKLKDDAKNRWQTLKQQLAQFDREKPTPPAPAFTVTDVGPVAPAVYIPGDRTKQEIQPGFLSVLDPSDLEVKSKLSHSTGRRTALAQWITNPDHPLASRVVVNRIWQYHFGQGIVATASDFGRMGDAPSHPELLDWLAKWFVDNDWSVKKLHRLIVTSATYRQAASSPISETAQLKDPDNRWLWHTPIRRLDAEQIRDASLAVSDELILTAGGPAVDAKLPRRTIFTKVIRNQRDPLLDVFDAPDNFNSTSSRNVTTTPTQSLLMINGPWILERAQGFAGRLQRQFADDHAARVQQAFLLAYGRPPTASQRDSAVAFLARSSPASQVTSASAGFAPFPGRPGQTLEVNRDEKLVPVVATGSPIQLDNAFTIEAVVLLRSLYQDAAVRTIASQWDSDPKHAGWSLGVTSAKSKYEPRNLILQIVGEAKEGSLYEVLPSNLRLELNKPYYVAVSVQLSATSDRGVTFLVQDLSRADAALQTASVSHKVLRLSGVTAPVVLGGRHADDRHCWHGLLDDVRLTAASLSLAALSTAREKGVEQAIGSWAFEADQGALHDSSPQQHDLTAQSTPSSVASPVPTELVDFCHVLLNSSEFLYVE